MKKNDLIICLKDRLKSLHTRYDVTMPDEHNGYITGYIKGIQEALALVRTLEETKQ